MESKSVRVHTPLFMRDVNASVQKGLGIGPNSNLGDGLTLVSSELL